MRPFISCIYTYPIMLPSPITARVSQQLRLPPSTATLSLSSRPSSSASTHTLPYIFSSHLTSIPTVSQPQPKRTRTERERERACSARTYNAVQLSPHISDQHPSSSRLHEPGFGRNTHATIHLTGRQRASREHSLFAASAHRGPGEPSSTALPCHSARRS